MMEEELLEQIDAVEYISQYVELEENGGEMWGISPFTNPPERTPSFSVRRETGKFFDFSSGKGGSLTSFVMMYHRCGYQEALQILEKFAGLDGEVTKRKRLAATSVARSFLPTKRKAVSAKDSTLPDDYMDRYLNTPSKLAVWESEGISADSLRRFQVKYDDFSNRLVYPIRNLDGKIVNIGGRTLDPDWKAKGLRKYTYFRNWAGGTRLLYGLYENLDAIKEKRCVIVFEGAKSVMLANTYGIHNTASILTSHLNEAQMKILIRLGCDVTFALDKEVNIRNDHNIQRLKQFLNVYYLYDRENLLDDKDAPVDKGKEVFVKLLTERRRFS